MNENTIQEDLDDVYVDLNEDLDHVSQVNAMPTNRIEERKMDFNVDQQTKNATIVEILENPYYEGVRMSQVNDKEPKENENNIEDEYVLFDDDGTNIY